MSDIRIDVTVHPSLEAFERMVDALQRIQKLDPDQFRLEWNSGVAAALGTAQGIADTTLFAVGRLAK